MRGKWDHGDDDGMNASSVVEDCEYRGNWPFVRTSGSGSGGPGCPPSS